MKRTRPADLPPPTPESLYRNLTRSGEQTALRWYYIRLYPYAVVAQYLWPTPSAQRYLAIQYSDGGYGKAQRPDQLGPRTLRSLLGAKRNDVAVAGLHMGLVATPVPAWYQPQQQVHAFVLEHELFVDLDLRDWEKVRPQSLSRLCTTCGAESVCRDCWVLVVLAAAVCRAWFGDLLGLGPMLIVASGGKGAHFHFATRRATPQ
jgi:hypothetical protein